MLMTPQTEAALLALLNGQPSLADIVLVQDLHIELIRRHETRTRLNTLAARTKELTR
jgi:hypothetical protein